MSRIRLVPYSTLFNKTGADYIMTKTYLAIIGKSGVGKNYIERILTKRDKFKKLNQITTRRMRDDEADKSNYLLFTSKEFYNKLKDKELLIAKTEVDGNLYGTLDDSINDNRIYTVIVNTKGLEDLLYNKSKLDGNIIVLNITGQSHDDRNRDLDKEISDIDYITEQALTYYTVPVINFENEYDDTELDPLNPFSRQHLLDMEDKKYNLIINELDKIMK